VNDWTRQRGEVVPRIQRIAMYSIPADWPASSVGTMFGWSLDAANCASRRNRWRVVRGAARALGPWSDNELRGKVGGEQVDNEGANDDHK
jgi:hypothetical protein